MALVASWLRRTPRLVRFLVVLLVAVGLPLTSAQAQTEDHVHIYVTGGTPPRNCETGDGVSVNTTPGLEHVVRFCVQRFNHAPRTGRAVAWSLSSPDGNAVFTYQEGEVAGLDTTRAGEAEARVRRTTEGSAIVRGTDINTGFSKSILVTWGAAPAFDHIHLVTAPGGDAGTCEEAGGEDIGVETTAEAAAGGSLNIVACVHDSRHQGVAGVPVGLETSNLGSATVSTATVVVTSVGAGAGAGKANFTVTSPTAGKSTHVAKASGRASTDAAPPVYEDPRSPYIITWQRAVDHVHVFLEGQGSCESGPATATVATGVTGTVIACVHGVDHDGIPSPSADPVTDDTLHQAVNWGYSGKGAIVSEEVKTDVNGQARAKVRSLEDGLAAISATSGGMTGNRGIEYLTLTIELTPATDSNEIGTTHTVMATVRDSSGAPASGTVVDFTAGGTGRESPSSGQPTTNAAGQTTFAFTSTATGISTITATVAAKSITATKKWICPPLGGAYFPRFDIARDIVLLPGENCKGYVLDGFGARHPFGGAPTTAGGPYFAGHDIARAMVLKPDGTGGFVLDGFGAMHPFDIGSPTTPTAKPVGGPYFPSQDIARDLILIGLNSGYVLDGYGARHPFGAVTATTGGPYFPGNDIANAFAMIGGENSAGYVLDGFGARHPFNGASAQSDGLYFPGYDIARDIVLTGASQGFVLDGLGARHPFGGQAAAVEGPYFPGFDIARRLVLAPSLKAGIVLDGFGGLHQFFVP